jgi:putative ABC transport system permease protein
MRREPKQSIALGAASPQASALLSWFAPMQGLTFLRIGWKLAWKDTRARFWRSAALVIALALSIAGLGGVRGATNIASEALHSGSRATLGGDVCVDTNEFLTERQIRGLNALRAKRVEWTMVTIFLTMVSSEEAADPTFAAVKVVDPALYPFYGRKNLAPLLQGDGVIVSEDALALLHVRVGDSIRIGTRKFRISATGQAEPEQIMGILSRGARCVMSRENFEKAGLARSGNSMRNRVLLRLPRGFGVRAAKQRLRALFPSSAAVDYQDVNRNTGVRIETAATFITEIALLALVLGSMGIALAVRQQVELRMKNFAVMKMIGARSGQLVTSFLFGTLLIIAAALPIGIAVGWMVKNALLAMASKFYVLPPESGGNFALMMEAPAAAVLTMIPAIAGPVWMIIRVRPETLLRDNVQPARSRARTLLWLSAIPCIAAFLEIVHRVLGSWAAAFQFSGALLLGAVFCAGLSIVFTRAPGRLRDLVQNLSPAIRLGLGNLRRPGHRAIVLTAAISAGIMMMVATVESGQAVVGAVSARLPWNLANSILIAGFNDSHREPILDFLKGVPGVTEVEMRTEVRLRLTGAEGVAHRRAGGWYVAGCSTRGLIIDEEMRQSLGAHPGSRLHFVAGSRRFSGIVSEISATTASTRLLIDCDQVDASDISHQAIIRAAASDLPAIGEAIGRQFPTLPLVTASEITAVVEEISRDAQFLARIVAWCFVASGLCILMALVAASRTERALEIGILSALGASPKVMRRIYTVEFASIGAIGGLVGTLMSSWLALVLLKLALDRWEFVFQWRIAAAAMVSSALLAAVAGWLPTYPLLRQKPLSVLRRE